MPGQGKKKSKSCIMNSNHVYKLLFNQLLEVSITRGRRSTSSTKVSSRSLLYDHDDFSAEQANERQMKAMQMKVEYE